MPEGIRPLKDYDYPEGVRPLQEEEYTKEGIRRLSKEDEQIAALRNIEQGLQNAINETVRPIKRVGQIYQEEMKAGRKTVARGISKEPQPLWKRAANIGFGTLQYVMSPITAVAKTTGETVFERPMKAAGAPKEIAEFAGKLGENAVYFVPIGGTLRTAMMARETVGFKASLGLGKTVTTKKPPPKATDKILKEEAKLPSGPQTELTEPVMKEKLHKGMTEPVLKEFDRLPPRVRTPDDRLFRQIGERITMGEIDFQHLAEIADKLNLSKDQIRAIFEHTTSFSGRWLGRLSYIEKQLRGSFANNKEALKALDEFYAGREQAPYFIDKAMQLVSSGVNLWRASLVSQVATSMRNAWSQAGRISISALDETLQAVIAKGVGGEAKLVGPKLLPATWNELKRDFNKAMGVLKIMKPKERTQFLKVLEEHNNVIHKSRLFSQPVHEVKMGKWASIINTLNRTQEMFFRRIAFEGKLRQQLAKRGLDFNSIDPKHIPDNVLEESINYALEMTFAAAPKSKAMKNFVHNWTNSPLVTVNPFPRFNFANAIHFVVEHSPFGYLNAIRPKTLKALASGDVDEFAKAASRATIGTIMLDSAIHLRQSRHAGERWYEVKTGVDIETGKSKNINLLPYTPLTMHFFIADALVNPERLKPSDYAKAAIGLNRLSGTGLVATDWFRAKSGETFKRQVGNFFGQLFGGFTVPTRTLSDFYSGIDEEEAMSRDWRESYVAPILLNLPKISQVVPERPSAFKRKKIKKGEPVFGIEGGVFRQLSGISVREKNFAEREIDRVGLEYWQVLPRTGIPEADRALSKYMAPYVEDKIIPLLRSPQYRTLRREVQQEVLKRLFSEAKKEARIKLAKNKPRLAIEARIKRESENIERMIKERTGIGRIK